MRVSHGLSKYDVFLSGVFGGALADEVLMDTLSDTFPRITSYLIDLRKRALSDERVSVSAAEDICNSLYWLSDYMQAYEGEMSFSDIIASFPVLANKLLDIAGQETRFVHLQAAEIRHRLQDFLHAGVFLTSASVADVFSNAISFYFPSRPFTSDGGLLSSPDGFSVIGSDFENYVEGAPLAGRLALPSLTLPSVRRFPSSPGSVAFPVSPAVSPVSSSSVVPVTGWSASFRRVPVVGEIVDMSSPYTYNGLRSVDVWYLSNFYLRRFYAQGKLSTLEQSRLLSSFLPFPLSVSPLVDSYFYDFFNSYPGLWFPAACANDDNGFVRRSNYYFHEVLSFGYVIDWISTIDGHKESYFYGMDGKKFVDCSPFGVFSFGGVTQDQFWIVSMSGGSSVLIPVFSKMTLSLAVDGSLESTARAFCRPFLW